MRILILNWRDIKNPSSGGAEVLTHEIAKRWVSWGHTVTQFSSFFEGAASKEIIDGVTILRQGTPDFRYLFFSVHFRAFLYYQRKVKEKFDVVIDEIHGIPFFTPWYIKEKKIALICEVGGELWSKRFGQFFGFIGIVTEKIYLKIIYKNFSYVTISQSTKTDLIKNGVGKHKITVLPMGFNRPEALPVFNKENTCTLLFVGRITVAKGIEDALYALQIVKRKIKNVKLWIVGRGEDQYIAHLKKIIVSLGIEKNIIFFGFTSEKEKFLLMGRAHILIHASVKEGFGLTVPEAGFVGTPVVAYNSPGLRDIIMHGENGLITKENTPQDLAKTVQELMHNDHLYKNLSLGAREESKKYNWDNTAKFLLSYIKNE